MAALDIAALNLRANTRREAGSWGRDPEETTLFVEDIDSEDLQRQFQGIATLEDEGRKLFAFLKEKNIDPTLWYVCGGSNGSVEYHCTRHSFTSDLCKSVEGMDKTLELNAAISSRYDIADTELWIFNTAEQQQPFQRWVTRSGDAYNIVDKHKTIYDALKKASKNAKARGANNPPAASSSILPKRLDIRGGAGAAAGVKLVKVLKAALKAAKEEGKAGVLTLCTKTAPIVLEWNESGVRGAGDQYLGTLTQIRKAYGAPANAPLHMDDDPVVFPSSRPGRAAAAAAPAPKPAAAAGAPRVPPVPAPAPPAVPAPKPAAAAGAPRAPPVPAPAGRGGLEPEIPEIDDAPRGGEGGGRKRGSDDQAGGPSKEPRTEMREREKAHIDMINRLAEQGEWSDDMVEHAQELVAALLASRAPLPVDKLNASVKSFFNKYVKCVGYLPKMPLVDQSPFKRSQLMKLAKDGLKLGSIVNFQADCQMFKCAIIALLNVLGMAQGLKVYNLMGFNYTAAANGLEEKLWAKGEQPGDIKGVLRHMGLSDDDVYVCDVTKSNIREAHGKRGVLLCLANAAQVDNIIKHTTKADRKSIVFIIDEAEWALVTDDGKDVSKKLKDFLFDAEGNLLIHSLYLISATDASLSCVLSSKNWKPQRIVQDPTKRAFETAGYVGLHNIRSFLPENSTFTGEAMNRENLYGFRQCGWKKEDFADTLASFTKGHLLPERRAVFDDSLGVKDPYEDEFASCSSGGSDSEDVRDEAEPMDQDVPRQGRDELMEAAAEVDVPALLAPRNLMRMEVDEEDEEDTPAPALLAPHIEDDDDDEDEEEAPPRADKPVWDPRRNSLLECTCKYRDEPGNVYQMAAYTKKLYHWVACFVLVGKGKGKTKGGCYFMATPEEAVARVDAHSFDTLAEAYEFADKYYEDQGLPGVWERPRYVIANHDLASVTLVKKYGFTHLIPHLTAGANIQAIIQFVSRVAYHDPFYGKYKAQIEEEAAAAGNPIKLEPMGPVDDDGKPVILALMHMAELEACQGYNGLADRMFKNAGKYGTITKGTYETGVQQHIIDTRRVGSAEVTGSIRKSKDVRYVGIPDFHLSKILRLINSPVPRAINHALFALPRVPDEVEEPWHATGAPFAASASAQAALSVAYPGARRLTKVVVGVDSLQHAQELQNELTPDHDIKVVEYRMREQAGPSGSKDTPPTPPFTEVHLKSNRDPYKIASKDLKGLWCRSSGIAVLRTSHMCGPTFGRALLDYAWDQITGRAPNYEIAIMITQEALTGYFTERRALEAAQAAAAAAQSRPADCLRGVAVNDQLFGGSTAFDDVYGGLHVEERGGVQYVRLWDGTEAALLTAFQVFEPTPEGAKQLLDLRLVIGSKADDTEVKVEVQRRADQVAGPKLGSWWFKGGASGGHTSQGNPAYQAVYSPANYHNTFVLNPKDDGWQVGAVFPLVAEHDTDFLTQATAYHKFVAGAPDDSGVPTWGVKLFVHKPAAVQADMTKVIDVLAKFCTEIKFRGTMNDFNSKIAETHPELYKWHVERKKAKNATRTDIILHGNHMKQLRARGMLNFVQPNIYITKVA